MPRQGCPRTEDFLIFHSAGIGVTRLQTVLSSNRFAGVAALGKGLASAALGALLQARGYSVRLRKLDPYLNVDPGTMSPYQHGEVFVTDAGAETDLALGHYERFPGRPGSRQD